MEGYKAMKFKWRWSSYTAGLAPFLFEYRPAPSATNFAMIDTMNRLPPEIFAIYFSPYTAHAIEINGVVYPTVEHAYQCLRYNDQKNINEIKSARSPVKAWETSAKYKQFQKPDFKDRKLEIMKMLMRAKADQHEDVKRALLNSGDLLIIKHIVTGPPGDGFWDDGEDGKGMNHMGNLWMGIREELRRGA